MEVYIDDQLLTRYWAYVRYFENTGTYVNYLQTSRKPIMLLEWKFC